MCFTQYKKLCDCGADDSTINPIPACAHSPEAIQHMFKNGKIALNHILKGDLYGSLFFHIVLIRVMGGHKLHPPMTHN